MTPPTVDLYELCTTIISDEKLAQLQTQKSCSSNKAAFCAAGEIRVKRSAEIQTFVHPATYCVFQTKRLDKVAFTIQLLQ